MAESKVEQILAKIRSDLDAIVGDAGANWWYTADVVKRVDEWAVQYVSGKAQYDVIYLVRDTAPERFVPGDAFGNEFKDIDVFVLAAYKDERAEKDPFRATTLSGTIRNRMVKDIVNKVTGDHTLGGLSINVDIVEVDRDIVAPQGWICAELQFTVRYSHAQGDV